jgi:HEAT repeat protein
MFLYSVLAVGGLVITGNVVGRSLFLSALPKSAIPLKFIIPPVVTVLVAAQYSKVASKYRTDRLILGTLGIAGIGLVFFRVGLSTVIGTHLVFLCALFVFFDVLVSIGMLQFWTLAGEVFDPREAKRVFALIASGGTLASILFGNLLHQLADRLASRDMIFIILICLAVMAWTVYSLGKSHGDRLEPTQADETTQNPSLTDSIKALKADPLLLSISFLVIVVAQVSCVADYQVDLAIQSHFGSDSQRMVGFLGSFRFWTGVAAAVIQFFLASRLLARFGLRVALLLLPIAMGAGSVAVIATGGLLWAVLIPRATDLVLKYTINQTAFNLLFLPVDPTRQRQAKVLISGILNPTMVCLLGLGFYFVERFLDLPIMAWSFVILVLVMAWLVTARRAAKYYIQSLQDNIRKPGFKTEWDTASLIDDRTADVLAKNLQHPDPRCVVHTLELIQQLPELEWSQHLAPLLEHRNEDVQQRVFRLIGQLGYRHLAKSVASYHSSESVVVAAAAVHCTCVLRGEEAVETVLPSLEHPSAAVRASAITGLIREGGLDGMLYAAEHLKALIESDSAEEKTLGARVLGDLEAKSFHRPLLKLLDDPTPRVRIAAARAAGRLGHGKLVQPLVGKLDDGPVRGAATIALSRCLGTDVSLLTTKLNDPQTDTLVRLAIIKVFEAQRTPLAADLLWDQLKPHRGKVRTAVIHGLTRLRRHRVKLPVRDKELLELLEEEVQNGYEICRFLPEEASDNLLDLTLESRFRDTCGRLLGLLALLYPEISLACIRASLYEDNDRMRAYGLELLDNVLNAAVKKLVFPLFASSRRELLEEAFEVFKESPRKRLNQLHLLVQSEDRWLRTCALYDLADVGDGNDVPCLFKSLNAQNVMERDTAWRALQKLTNNATLIQYCQKHENALTGSNFLESLHPQKGGEAVALSDLEELLFLRTVPLFSELSPEDLTDIVPITEEIHFAAGEKIITQGEEGDCLFVIVEGTAKVIMEGAEISTCQTPETLGELSVLAERPRSADCVAETHVVALRLAKSDFWALLDERPEIAKGVIKTLLKYT